MATYGYQQRKFGAGLAPKMQPFQPQRALAKAAAGTPTVGDPFGLTPQPGRPSIDGGIVAPRTQTQAPQAPVATPPPVAAAAPQTGTNAPAAPAATPPAYDINTDPALQLTNASAQLSDEQAQALADKQSRDAILNSGFEELARKVFGDETLAHAAAQNPTSTKAQLGHTRDQSLQSLLTALTTGGHNLGYSGYRVRQEGELGDQYQNALAQAAAGTQGTLDQIRGNLVSTKGQNARDRSSALGDAYSRFVQQALLNPPIDTGGAGGGTDGGTDGGGDAFGLNRGALTGPDDNYWNLLGLAAAARKPVYS